MEKRLRIGRARGAAHGVLRPGEVAVIQGRPNPILVLFAAMIVLPTFLAFLLANGVSPPIALALLAGGIAALVAVRRLWLRARLPLAAAVRRAEEQASVSVVERGREFEMSLRAPEAVVSWTTPTPEPLAAFGKPRCVALRGPSRPDPDGETSERDRRAGLSAIYWSCDRDSADRLAREAARALDIDLEMDGAG